MTSSSFGFKRSRQSASPFSKSRLFSVGGATQRAVRCSTKSPGGKSPELCVSQSQLPRTLRLLVTAPQRIKTLHDGTQVWDSGTLDCRVVRILHRSLLCVPMANARCQPCGKNQPTIIVFLFSIFQRSETPHRWLSEIRASPVHQFCCYLRRLSQRLSKQHLT